MDDLASAQPAPGEARKQSGRLLGDLAESGVSLVDTMNVLRRRRSVIAACVGLITTIGVAVMFQLTPIFTAESSVLLDVRKTQILDMQSVLSGLPPDLAVLRGEIEVLKSPSIAQDVVKKLNLTTVPEFNSRLRTPSSLAPISNAAHWLVGELAPLLGIHQNAAPLSTDPDKAALLATTYALMQHVDVLNDGRSYVLKIQANSENPQLAASIANAYANSYLDSQLEAKFDAVRRANDWLNQHLTELRQQVEDSDRAVELYRAQHGLTQTSTEGQTLTTQQLGELNSQLILAAADRAQKEAALNQIQERMKSGGISGAEQTLASPLIATLRQQQADLVQQEAQLATKYKPEHPAMINIKAQEQDVQRKIRDEITKAVQAMSDEVAAARAKEASLRTSLENLQKTAAAQGQTQVGLRELERQADSNKTLYEDFLNRFKQTSAQEDIQQPDARLIATARVPGGPSYPRPTLFIAIVFLGSIVVGVAAAFGIERLDNGFRTGEQIERIAHVTPLGLVPMLTSGEKPQDEVISRPVSAYAEAIRTIRTALRYSDVDNPPKVVLVTSALPDEGKSVFSLSLARSVAFSGGRALLIDCDLRRPSVAKQLKADVKTNVLSLFEPNADFKSAVHVDEVSGMHFLPSVSGTANPQDLLGSKQFRSLVERMRNHYDLIVLDTPPVLAVSDALILSHIADTTMFLVRWGRTARPVVLGALKSFRQNGGNLAGIVLSRVDFRRHATYGYGDSGYYYGYYGGTQYGSYEPTYGKSQTEAGE